jgi:beta-glucosidase
VNPSGRLPVTFPVSEDEIPVNTQEQYPGINNEADYSEGLLVGYRWYDDQEIDPLFPFGTGYLFLSKTKKNSSLTIR